MADSYAEIDACNFSTLKWIDVSPREYLYRLAHPTTPTPAMRSGTLAHVATLEPEELDARYAVWRGKGDRRSKAYKEWAAGVPGGVDVVTAAEYDTARSLADAVHGDPLARDLLSGGATEVVVTWTDPDTGIECKGKIDFVGSAIVDLKRTKDYHPRHYPAVQTRSWHFVQQAMYGDGWASNNGEVLPAFNIAVQPEPPHDVAVYEFTTEELTEGSLRYQLWLETVKQCRADNYWPGVGGEPMRAFLPGWYNRLADDGLDLSNVPEVAP